MGRHTGPRWLAHLGDQAYERALDLNKLVNRVRRFFGLPYWSLSAVLKRKVKTAVEFISHFEDALVSNRRPAPAAHRALKVATSEAVLA